MTTETPKMWDVIDKMNDELAEVQTELNVMKGAFKNTTNENIVMKNIIKGLLIKIITLDKDCDLVSGGMKLFNNEGSSAHGYHRQPGTYEEIMKKIIKEMNDDDWNEDDGYCKLYYKSKILECFMDDDSSDDDSSDED